MRPHRRVGHRVALHFFERRRVRAARRSARCSSSPAAGSRRRERSTRSPLRGPCRSTASCRSPTSIAKNWPRFLFDSPKIVVPLTAGELIYIDTCSLRHRGVAVHPLPSAAGDPQRDRRVVEAGGDHHVVDDERRDEFWSYGVLNGSSHISRPSAAATPISLFCDCVITWRVPRERRDDRRGVSGPVAGPSPLDGAGGRIHRRQRAGILSAEERDHRSRRRRSASLMCRIRAAPAARSCATAACRWRDRARRRCR